MYTPTSQLMDPEIYLPTPILPPLPISFTHSLLQEEVQQQALHASDASIQQGAVPLGKTDPNEKTRTESDPRCKKGDATRSPPPCPLCKSNHSTPSRRSGTQISSAKSEPVCSQPNEICHHTQMGITQTPALLMIGQKLPTNPTHPIKNSPSPLFID